VAFLRTRSASAAPEAAPAPRFDLAHLLWYAGALIVIGAMGLFSTVAFSEMGGYALTTTAVVYAALFTLAGHHLWHRRGLRIPGGLLIAIAVSMAPLAVYGVQSELDVWSHGTPGRYRDFYHFIKASFLYMEIATLVAAAIALYFYPFPFIVAIASVALWFMSMDIVQWVYGTTSLSWDMRRTVSLWFGLGTLIAAWVVDQRRWRDGDFAFWLHLFGLIMFWGGLSLTEGGTPLTKAIYCLINVLLMLLAVFFRRAAYAAFGALGVALYLGDLASRMFRDSLLFPFALSLIGVAIIALGLYYYRRQPAIAAWFDRTMPDALKRLRPAHAR
jgi:hypothetical protein